MLLQPRTPSQSRTFRTAKCPPQRVRQNLKPLIFFLAALLFSSQFFVNISVGSPRQDLTVILDSGSSVFAIFSSCVHGLQLPLKCVT